MKRLPVLVLLFSVVLICSTAPALEPVTCSEDSGVAAARLAMHHINEHHDHGYKFKLNEIQGNKLEKVEEGCNFELQLELLETVCHTVNPKHFEDCEIREETDWAVMANCTIMMAVKAGDAKVTKYGCDTRQVKTKTEMIAVCPDCPTLSPLNSPEGLNSVNKAVNKFNQNTTNQGYYILQEVGRIKSGYITMAGMSYDAEFALVETYCPVGTRIILEACKPLCPGTATITALGPGDQEAICRHFHPVHLPHAHGHEPTPHADGGVPPPHAHGQVPPPQNEGGVPPPCAHGQVPHLHAGGGVPPPHARSQVLHSNTGGGVPPTHAHVPPSHNKGGVPLPCAHGQVPHLHAGGGVPQTHAHGQGPPPHAGGGVTPPHAHGHMPPSHGHGQGPGHKRVHLLQSCHGFLTHNDPALHPICPWPHPEPRPNPKKS